MGLNLAPESRTFGLPCSRTTGFHQLSMRENKPAILWPKRRTEPSLGMGKGKSSKNNLVSDWLWEHGGLWEKKGTGLQAFTRAKPNYILKQGQIKARGEEVQDWVRNGGGCFTCSLNHRPKSAFVQMFDVSWQNRAYRWRTSLIISILNCPT